jgi:signal-transduction protein with cAMP-binding, CBS, and nucleotidyltransferase domain
MRVQCFGPEETIIREGEKGERFYIINDGEVAVFKNNGGNEVGGGGRSRGVNALPLKKKKKNQQTCLTLRTPSRNSLRAPWRRRWRAR